MIYFPRHRTAGEDTGGTYPSVEDSQEVCTTSFSTSPPSQVGGNRFWGSCSWYIYGPYEMVSEFRYSLFWWWW